MTGARHASAGTPASGPSLAEQARTLIARVATGTLATQSARRPGFPFASVAPYALDGDGRPTFLLSALAAHTQNLVGDPRASLLVTEPAPVDEPLAGARVTLLGTVALVPPDDEPALRDAYLGRHAGARAWAGFDDFRLHRMETVEAYVVAGFGVMGWVDGPAYREAEPDPLAPAAARILEHMNADHADALRLYCRAFAGVAADGATMTAVDRLGFRVRARTGEETRVLRIDFPREVRTADAARVVLVEMVRAARARTEA